MKKHLELKRNIIWSRKKSALVANLCMLSFCILLISASLISCTPKNNAKKDSASKYRNVIYTYTLGDVTYPEMYTHVIISFFKADNVGNLFEKSFPHTPETVKTFKKEHPNVKVLGAIGGGSYSEFLTPVMLDEEYRTRLAKQLCDFVASHHLDGIDLDWEYYEDYPESNAAYLDFAQQLRKKLPKNAVLSMAGQKAPQFYRDETIVKMMKDVLDFTNVMTYDFDYDNKMNRTVGYNGSFTETKLTMNDYAKALGGDKSKLNTGLPFYGSKFKIKDTEIHFENEPVHSFSSGSNYTATTAALGVEGAKNPQAYDDDDGVAISVKGHDLFVFDNETTLTNKVNWSCSQGFGGVMEWVASDDDAACTLQKAVSNALKAQK